MHYAQNILLFHVINVQKMKSKDTDMIFISAAGRLQKQYSPIPKYQMVGYIKYLNFLKKS